MLSTLKRWMRWGLGIHLGSALVIVAGAYLGALPLRVQAIHAQADKVLHFLIIGGVAFWLVGLWDDARLKLGALRLPLAILVPLAAAGIEEAMQVLSPRRNADPLDFLADALGLLAFYAIGRLVVRNLRPPSAGTPSAGTGRPSTA